MAEYKTDLLDITLAVVRGWWLVVLLPIVAVAVSIAMYINKQPAYVAELVVPYGESTAMRDVPELIRAEVVAFGGAGVSFTPTRATLTVTAGDADVARARLDDLADRLAMEPVLPEEEMEASRASLNRLQINLHQTMDAQNTIGTLMAGASGNDLVAAAMVNIALQNEITRREEEIARVQWQAGQFLTTDTDAEISVSPHRTSPTASIIVPAMLAFVVAVISLVAVDGFRRAWHDPANADSVGRIMRALTRERRAN